MRSEEFINKLFEEAGDGCFIRWSGVPISAELSTQGPFSYVGDDGKIHYTMDGYGVVIKTKKLLDFIHKDLAEWYSKNKRSSDIMKDRPALLKQLMKWMKFEMDEMRSKWYIEQIERELDNWLEIKKQKA